MSHTPRLVSGYSFKRFLNAKRLRAAESPVVPTDPFFADVLVLMAYDVEGTTYTDYGPLSASTTVTPTVGTSYLACDNDIQLFGLPTLHVIRLPSQTRSSLSVRNNTPVLLNTTSLTLECFAYQVSATATAGNHPALFSYVPVLGTQFIQYTSSNNVNRFVQTQLGSGPTFAYSLGSWVYICAVYNGAEKIWYYYENSVYKGQVAAPTSNTTGVVFNQLSGTTAGSAIRFYNAALAQFRATRVNRYGIDAGNYLTNPPPIPVAPWPKTGP